MTFEVSQTVSTHKHFQVVYNYLKKEVSAEVTLENTEDSAFVFGSKDANAIEGSGPAVDLFRTKRVEVKTDPDLCAS